MIWLLQTNKYWIIISLNDWPTIAMNNSFFATNWRLDSPLSQWLIWLLMINIWKLWWMIWLLRLTEAWIIFSLTDWTDSRWLIWLPSSLHIFAINWRFNFLISWWLVRFLMINMTSLLSTVTMMNNLTFAVNWSLNYLLSWWLVWLLMILDSLLSWWMN